MPIVETVRGPVETSELGFTLMHEHLLIFSSELARRWPPIFDLEESVDVAVQMVNEAHRHGVDTIVDLTTPNIGREIDRLRQIAERTDVNIVIATGIHPRMPIPAYILLFGGKGIGIDGLADLFVREIEEGVGDSTVKAGSIKVGIDPAPDANTELVVRAAARAHRRTGVPISTHTFAGNQTGMTLLDILESEGVDPRRVVLGHAGDSDDLDYLSALVERGSIIGMDRFGMSVPGFPSLDDATRIDTVAAMCASGHASRMVISHDACCWADIWPPGYIDEVAPDWHLAFIPTEVIPRLLAAGVSQSEIDLMTRENPRRFFEQQGAY